MAYEQVPGVTGNISSGGQYDNLDTVDALQYGVLAAEDAAAAALSASAAATSAAAALVSENNADTSEANALSSANSASISEANAIASATSAATSATNASVSASSASASAASATASANSADISEANALSSENAAALSATSAASSASTATAQAGIATTNASEASTSASQAATSATNAATSASQAATSATNAGASASAAATSATNAASSASASATSAASSAASASAAATSETNAANSASAASTSETNAATSATSASSSAVSAAASANNAAQSASDAAATLASSLKKADNLSDLSNVSTARTNLGLGTSAVLDAGVANGVATLDAGGAVPLSQLPSSIKGGVTYQGTWNASTNTPLLVSGVGSKGHYYVVSVAGNTIIDGLGNWQPGDWIIFDGIIWEKIDNTDAVSSVNGYTGAVALTYTDVGAANAGANTNIASMSGITGGISTPDYIDLDTTAAATNIAGRIRWNSARGVPAFGVVGGNVSLEAGETGQLVRNAETTTLVDGEVVYLFGAQGDLPTVKRASNASDATSAAVLGMISETIAPGATGWVTTEGMVSNLNTSAYADGTILWLGSSPGTYTSVKPVAPQHMVFIGVVNRSNAGNGIIYVNPQNGYELDELHDVLITSPIQNDILVRNGTTNVWENKQGTTLYDAVGVGVAMAIALG